MKKMEMYFRYFYLKGRFRSGCLQWSSGSEACEIDDDATAAGTTAPSAVEEKDAQG